MPKGSPFVAGHTAEYQDRFARSRMVQGPLADPLPAAKPLWHDLLGAVFLAVFLLAVIVVFA